MSDSPISMLPTSELVGLDEVFRDMVSQTLDRAALLADVLGAQTIDYLRSLTSEMNPPGRRGGGPRPAHPGHWSDVTGLLARSYAYRVLRHMDSVELVLDNTASYAAELEQRDGFYVISGVTDPDGPVERNLRDIMRLTNEFVLVSP